VLPFGACGITVMMEIKILGHYRDQAGTAVSAGPRDRGKGPGRRAALGSTEISAVSEH